MPGNITNLVIDSAASANLTTLKAAKAELGLTDTTDDAYLRSLIVRASAIISNWVGYQLATKTVTETFRLPQSPRFSHQTMVNPLITTYTPLLAITSLVADGTTLTNTDYEFSKPTGFIWRLGSPGIPTRQQWQGSQLAITYTSGYVLPLDSDPYDPTRDLPYDIEDVCLNLVRSGYYQRANDPSVILEVTESVGRIGYQKTSKGALALDDAMIRTLARYRNMVY